MKKRLVALVLAGTMALGMVGCGGSSDKSASKSESSEAAGSSELVDGKFAETKHITVEVYDRGNDGGTDPTDNMYTDYIKKGMLEDHNVEVEFVSVPRWTETEEINNLLASGGAPDICLTYSYPTIQTYANMGGVTDLKPVLSHECVDTSVVSTLSFDCPKCTLLII